MNLQDMIRAIEDPAQYALQTTHSFKHKDYCSICTDKPLDMYQELIQTTASHRGDIVHIMNKRYWPEFEYEERHKINSDTVYDYAELRYILNKGTYYIKNFDESQGMPVDLKQFRNTIVSKLRKLIWCGHTEGKLLLTEDAKAYILAATNAFLQHVEQDYQPALDLLDTLLQHVEQDYQPALDLLDTLMKGDLKDV